jgi:hypothetical protein
VPADGVGRSVRARSICWLALLTVALVAAGCRDGSRDGAAGARGGGSGGGGKGGASAGGGNEGGERAGDAATTGDTGSDVSISNPVDAGPTSGTGGGGGSAHPATGPLEEAVRLATIDASHAVREANRDKSKAEQDAALVSFFLAQPTIEAAGLSETNGVWARFTDGVMHYVFSNRPGLPGGAPPAGASPPPVTDESALALFDLPASTTAISAFSLEPGWTDVSARIGKWLDNAGYHGVKTGGLTVDDFENMSDVAVLFWQTHSATIHGRALSPPEGGVPPEAFAFMTSTIATVALGSGRYKWLRDNLYLATGGTTIGVSEPRYALTEKYISERLKGKFAPHALVAIDSCTGAAAAGAWAAAGVSAFVGWDDESGFLSPIAFERMFDRLLGANDADPFSTPQERPFPLTRVEVWMKDHGYDLDRSIFAPEPPGSPLPLKSKAKLQFFHNGTSEILRPTIQRIINTINDRYLWTIEGSFGIDPGRASGTVTYGTRTLEIVSWSAGGQGGGSGGPDSILVAVPADLRTNPPSGDIVVAVGDRKSEPVPMTEWLLPFTYTLIGEETLNYVVKVNCRLRADVRGVRNGPADALIYPSTVTWALADSDGSVSASGVLRDPGGRLLEAWSGGGALRAFEPTASTLPGNFVSFSGVIDLATSRLRLLPLIAIGDYQRTTPAGTSTVMASLKGVSLLDLTLDSTTLGIKAGSVAVPPQQLTSPDLSATLTWPDVMPINPPTAATAR